MKTFFLESRPCLSFTYAVHINCIPKRNLLIPTLMGFVDFQRSVHVSVLGFFIGADEECVNIVLEQKLVPISSVSILCPVGALQTIESRPRDVDASGH